ncbi:MAG: hypothetical protein LBG92_05945, partial [Prevotellaceae bacterium]|nr:hypothetical protein [Prevotellaceae bacterium]
MRNPEAIAAAKDNPRYNIADNNDGTVTVKGIYGMDNRWHGEKPENDGKKTGKQWENDGKKTGRETPASTNSSTDVVSNPTGLRNDTATPQNTDVSDSKGTTNSQTGQTQTTPPRGDYVVVEETDGSGTKYYQIRNTKTGEIRPNYRKKNRYAVEQTARRLNISSILSANPLSIETLLSFKKKKEWEIREKECLDIIAATNFNDAQEAYRATRKIVDILNGKPYETKYAEMFLNKNATLIGHKNFNTQDFLTKLVLHATRDTDVVLDGIDSTNPAGQTQTQQQQQTQQQTQQQQQPQTKKEKYHSKRIADAAAIDKGHSIKYFGKDNIDSIKADPNYNYEIKKGVLIITGVKTPDGKWHGQKRTKPVIKPVIKPAQQQLFPAQQQQSTPKKLTETEEKQKQFLKDFVPTNVYDAVTHAMITGLEGIKL